jgi:phosphodiesterase/alkaline phosphatase D-like protein
MKSRLYHLPLMITAIVVLLATACKKEEPATIPSLSTTPVSNITATTAISGGVISDDGGATLTANGVCWGKTENPTIEGSKTNESVSTGQYVSHLSGLDAGTTYHVRAYATNAVGTSYGADMTFLTLGQAPSGLTQQPTNVNAVSATLNATVNPNDLSTIVTFEYGLTTSYGSTATASPSPVTGNAMVNVMAEISGLLPATTYHYRVKMVNSIGTTYSEDKTFTTAGIPPIATTSAATSKTTTGAALNGTVNANNTSTTVTFEYGTTTSYGQTVSASPSPIADMTNTDVSASITGLTAGTTYHFRVKAVNSLGTTYGSDMTFTTEGLAPTATTKDATNKTSTSATLNASVNANMASTTVTFEYGTTTSYGQTVTASPSPVTGSSNTNVSANISGLSAGTTYHFRIKAVNSVGTTHGSDMTFTTVGLAPTATTLDATSKTASGATLNASVNANMASTTVTFEYGTTTSYGQTVNATPSTVTGNSSANVSASITGLTAGTTYHFRVKAVNSVGTTYGSDMTFTTQYAPPPTNGLVGYWSFTGNANDESGNNHHGTVNGATLTTERFGAANGAYSFDGLNDYIAIAPSSLVDNETAATLSFWIKRGATDDYGLPIHTGNQGYLNTQVKKDSVLVAVCTNSSYDGSAPTEFGVKWTYIQQTQWNHVILRYDGTAKNLRLYINGIQKKEVFAEGNIWSPQSAYLAFGVYYLFGTPHHGYYKGILDDVRLYKRALDNSEIQSLYHEGGW